MAILPILSIDPALVPYKNDLLLRQSHYKKTLARLGVKKNNLSGFANGHLYFGFHEISRGWVYREWAPYAKKVMLIGDFNNWDRRTHPLKECGNGSWEIEIQGIETLFHGCRVKVEITTRKGDVFDRIPLYSKRIMPEGENGNYNAEIWNPQPSYKWASPTYQVDKGQPLLIYEAHIGISGEAEEVVTFQQFTKNVIPRIKKLGYNAIQLMAVAEHSYYASFGYQVTNFFAVSSRFGTPDDFKQLIDVAHQNGIAVLLDLVHSHASPNTMEGIALFDGTDYQFFCSGKSGTHPVWGTKLFNYGKSEVIHFLLSNLKYWMEEYCVDGFRFDGVTSMLYQNHGIGQSFLDYKQYFSMNTNVDAVAYLQMATTLCHQINPDSILICEDMSGMPGMCIPCKEGGIGFDYRLGMGLPDFWIQTLRERRDEEWNLNWMWHELTQRRPQEKAVAYCESHDQALVGDKTIMFWLADKEMYTHMDNTSQSVVIERAMALHKMIRLITAVCGGEAYLNFMGNEFGHPEWIDFPREGNGWSYQHANRKWSLADNPFLRYQYLQNFDIAMLALLKKYSLQTKHCDLQLLEESSKLVVFENNGLYFVFNFHPTRQYNWSMDLPCENGYSLAMHTEWQEFGGKLTQSRETIFAHRKSKKNQVVVVLPRSAFVLLPMDREYRL